MRGLTVVVALLALIAGAANAQVNQEMIARVAAGEVTEARASWWGFDEEDATEALQAAINSGARKLIVENMGRPWIVSPLFLASNQEIVFEEGCEILARRGEYAAPKDAMINILSVENVTLSGYGATMRMWRDDYDDPALYTKAEWRHVINMRGASNINILGLLLTESGGDGIYLGAGPESATNTNVQIRDVVCDRNYRQGISVITAENLLIENTVMSNTGGTAPQAGIDFEPNSAREKLVNVVMRNCRTENNVGGGYVFYIPNLHADSDDVSIRVENCRSIGDRGSSMHTTISNASPVGGLIEFMDCLFAEGQSNGVLIRDKPTDGAEMRFENCAIIDAAMGQEHVSPVTLIARPGALRDVGGVHFENVLICDDSDRKPIAGQSHELGVNFRDLTGTIVLERNGEQTPITLTEELVASWMPVYEVPDVPRIALDGLDLAPVQADASPEAYSFSGFRIRREVTPVVYAEAGDEVRMSMAYLQIARLTGETMPVTVVAPSGATIEAGELPFGEEAEVGFTAPQSGLYRVVVAPDRNQLRINASTHPVSLSTEDAPVQLYLTTGALYFWVPEGTEQFGVVLYGENPGEGVQATLYDPAGEPIEALDNVTAARMISVENPAGGAWRIELSRPTEVGFEDYMLELRGVPPLLAPSAEALLKPR